MVNADSAQRFREILTAASDAGRQTTTSTEALFDADDVWHHVVVQAGREVPLVAWLLDEGLALPHPEGMVLPVRCTAAAAHAFARQLLVRAAAAGQHLGAAEIRRGEHPGEAYVRRVFGDRVAAAMRASRS